MPKSYIKRIKSVGDIFTNWVSHDSRRSAAASAFYTLFSFTPLVVILIDVLRYFLDVNYDSATIYYNVSKFFNPDIANLVDSIIQQKIDFKKDIFIFVFVLFVTAPTVLVELRMNFDRIWSEDFDHISDNFVIRFLKSRLYALLFIPIMSGFFLLAFLLEYILFELNAYQIKIFDFSIEMAFFTEKAVVFTITMLLFFTMFRLLPSWHAKLKYTIWGTFVTTILFLIGKFLLSIYLSKSEISSYYGAASTLVSMMLWLFYTYQIIFFGAEIIVYLQQRNTDNKIVSGCNKTNILDI